MEEAKKKIRICLICVVMAATLIGVCYYVMMQRQTVSQENGTLVSIRLSEGGNDGKNEADFIYQRG